MTLLHRIMAARSTRGRVQSGWGDGNSTAGVSAGGTRHRSEQQEAPVADDNPSMEMKPPVFMRPVRTDRSGRSLAEHDAHTAKEQQIRAAKHPSDSDGPQRPLAGNSAGGDLLFPSSNSVPKQAARDRGSRRGSTSSRSSASEQGDADQSLSTDPYALVDDGSNDVGECNFEDDKSLFTGNPEQVRLSFEAEASLRRLFELTDRPLPEIEARKGASSPPVILWMRQDLRLTDNPALDAAIRSGRPVIPVYLHVPSEEGKWPLGGAALYWLHFALLRLSEAFESKLGSRLLIFSGDSSLELLLQLIMDTSATALCFNRVYEPWKISRDALIG